MEYLDILDPKGNPTGVKKLRKEAHRDGDWHRTVHVWIFNDRGEFLMQQLLSTNRSYPNLWDVSCSGHIVSGDDSRDTARRELEEELGINVSADELKFVYSAPQEGPKTQYGQNNEIHDIYAAHVQTPINVRQDPGEMQAIAWMPVDELVQRIVQNPEQFHPREDEYERVIEYFRDIRHSEPRPKAG